MGQNSKQLLASSYQGIAGLAGVNLPGGEIETKIDLVVETLKSRDFLRQLANQHPEIIPNIYAVNGFDSINNKLLYDNSIYSDKLNSWIVDNNSGISKNGPKFFKVHNIFHNEIFKIYVNPSNNFILLSVEHYSPIYSQDLLIKIIDSLNSLLRDKAILKSEQALLFLQTQAEKYSQKEINYSIYSLIEKNLETLMLANINKYYIIEPLDLPNLPERKIFPNRKIFLLLGLFFGFFISTGISFIFKLKK